MSRLCSTCEWVPSAPQVHKDSHTISLPQGQRHTNPPSLSSSIPPASRLTVSHFYCMPKALPVCHRNREEIGGVSPLDTSGIKTIAIGFDERLRLRAQQERDQPLCSPLFGHLG